MDAGETDLSWTAWCARYIKRSGRDIRRVIALARADDPVQARENEKARNRAAKPPGSRATSPLQVSDQRTGASPPVAPALKFGALKDPPTELRQAMEQYWPWLSRAEQQPLIDWLIEHMADPPRSTVARGHEPPKAKPLPGDKMPADRSIARPTASSRPKRPLFPGGIWLNSFEVGQNLMEALTAAKSEAQQIEVTLHTCADYAVVAGARTQPWRKPSPFPRLQIIDSSATAPRRRPTRSRK